MSSLGSGPETKRLKRKAVKGLDGNYNVSDLLVGWTQCNFYMENKRRLCNVGRTPGSLFCGNHKPASECNTDDSGRSVTSERIPCPVDPSHTIYKHNLNSHVKICNVTRLNKHLAECGYYSRDCNSGNNASIATGESKFGMNSANADELLVKIKKCYSSIVEKSILPYEPISTMPMIDDAIVREMSSSQSSFQKTRHALQDAEIAKRLIQRKLLQNGISTVEPVSSSNDSTSDSQAAAEVEQVYVELGAGRGYLGYGIQIVNPKARCVFVERSGVRRKADKVMKEKETGAYERVRMDIRHCNVGALPAVQRVLLPAEGSCSYIAEDQTEKQPGVTIVAKHLCGLATDLAMHAYAQLLNSRDGAPSDACASTARQTSVSVGLGIATCCHHACSWGDYVGSAWWLAQGFTEDEFNIMKHWSGWATYTVKEKDLSGTRTGDCKDGKCAPEDNRYSTETPDAADDAVDAPEHTVPTAPASVPRPTNISQQERISVGKMVKRIIDHGRVVFLREKIDARSKCADLPVQLQYCEPKFTPECVLITARCSV